MSATEKRLTAREWNGLRPEIERWYVREQRTARWIAEELKHRVEGAKITRKMVYDRLTKHWHVKPKYNKSKTEPVGEIYPQTAVATRNSSSNLVAPRAGFSVLPLQRAVSTSPEDYPFHDALTPMGDYLRNLRETGSWQKSATERRIEMQRLTSSATMAIAEISNNKVASLSELANFWKRFTRVLLSFSYDDMHPRTLTALVRLWVEKLFTHSREAGLWKSVRSVVWRQSEHKLAPTHPIALLSKLSTGFRDPSEADNFLTAFFQLFKNAFWDPIRSQDPDFAAREQIYGARVLASLGRYGDAAVQLSQLDEASLRETVDPHTVADYYSTFAFALLQAENYDDALVDFTKAQETFDAIGEGHSEGAMYAHMGLAQICGKKNDMGRRRLHLEAALAVWKAKREIFKDQGGFPIVRDLHEVYEKLGWREKMDELKKDCPQYFGAVK